MRNHVVAAIAALSFITPAAFANTGQPSLDGAVKGTANSPAAGDVRVVSNEGRQFIKFDDQFQVASQAETEVRLVDGKTGKQTVVGHLVKRKGAQSYTVPANLKVDSEDRIVLYSPLQAEDLATVDLQAE